MLENEQLIPRVCLIYISDERFQLKKYTGVDLLDEMSEDDAGKQSGEDNLHYP